MNPPIDESYGLEQEPQSQIETPSEPTASLPTTASFPNAIEARAVRIVAAVDALVDLAMFEVSADDPAIALAVQQLRTRSPAPDAYATLIDRVADLIESAPAIVEELMHGLDGDDDEPLPDAALEDVELS